MSDKIEAPAPVRFTSNHLDITLEPTVVVWERQAHLDLESTVRRAVTTIQRALAAPPATISIQAGSYRVIPDVGIGGYTSPVSGEIKITMDQRSPVGLRRMLTVWLPLALAHELHHTKRILDGPGYGTTVLEAIVTEGSAEAFVRATYPDAPAIPWVRPLGPDEAEVWHRARREAKDLDEGAQHDSWFFGDRGLPRWAGYRLGYAIAETYLERHPDRSAADLATMPAEEILAEYEKS